MYRCLWYARGLCLCPCAITPRWFTPSQYRRRSIVFRVLFQQTNKPKKSKKERKLFRTIVPIQSFPPKKILNKQIDHFKKTFHNLNTLPTYKYIHFKTTFMCPGSIAGVPLSQALPGFLITAPSSVLVPAVIGALAVWIQNQKTTKKAPVNL